MHETKNADLSKSEPYSAPHLTTLGKATALLQRRPSGGEVDRGARKPVVVARPAKKTKKKKK